MVAVAEGTVRSPVHPSLIVFLDEANRASPRPVGLSATKAVLTPGAVRQMLCDASVIPVVLGGDSLPLDIGRARRTTPWWIRKALNLRDQGCVIPGCHTRARYCDAHHVIHWLHGGNTSLANLCLLCARHHTLVHEGKVRLPDLHEATTRRRPNRE